VTRLIPNLALLTFALTALSAVAGPAYAKFSDVDLRGNTMCAITIDGVARCSDRPQVTTPDDLPNVVDIAAAQSAACVVTDAGDLRCWGDDGYGIATDAPSAGAPYRSVSTNLAHACAINRDSAIECWGLPNNDRLNAPSGAYQQISVAQRQACALDFDGVVSCWGLAELGTLDVPADLPPAQKVQAGTAGSCALLFDGSIQCWGFDLFIPSGGPFVDFSATNFASLDGASVSGGICGVDSGGYLHCAFTRLFQNNLTSPTYGEPPNEGGHLDVAVGSNGGCYITSDNDIGCFGTVFADIPTAPGGGGNVPTTTGLTASIYSDSTVELFWDAPIAASLVAGHEIQRNGVIVAFTQNLSSYIVDDLVAGESTEFAVRQVSFTGDVGEFSESVTVLTGTNSGPNPPSGGYTPPARPYEPTGLEAFVYSDTRVEVVWDRAPGTLVGGYEIRRNGDYIQFTNGTSFIDDVPAGTVFVRYEVIPVNRTDPTQLLGVGSILVGFGGAEPALCF